MSLRSRLRGLSSGQNSYDFVGKTKTWYLISGLILVVTVGALAFRGLNLGLEFRGGAEYRVPSAECSVEQARTSVQGVIGGEPIVTQVGASDVRVQTEEVTPDVGEQVREALATTCGVSAEEVSLAIVGPTWGSDVSKKALQGLIVFLILVSIFLAVYFEFKMAIAALVALAHDLVITLGVYALLGFEVTPATAIGLLTILGYSLYDTVVVFDKVKENTDGILGQSRQTYAEAANLAVNQTLVRSINTTIVGLLPVGAILFVGAGLLGAGTLKDLALALFVGMAAGAYSSICVATPLLVQLKYRDPEVQALERRVASRRRKSDDPTGEPVPAGAGGPGDTSDAGYSRTVTESADRQQPRRQTRSQRRN